VGWYVSVRSNQTLDLGRLGVGLRALLLGGNLTADDKLANLNYNRQHLINPTRLPRSDSTLCGTENWSRLNPKIGVVHSPPWRQDWRRSYEKTHIIFLAEAEEAADLGGTLGTEALGVDGVGDTWDVLVALLDDAESEDGEVHADDATANRLPLALTSAAGAVAGVAIGEEEADTGWVHDTLLHGETLLVVASGDPEDVALELVADAVAGDFVTHAAVHEDAELALIFDLDQLLGAIVGVGDVELHLDCGVSRAWEAATLVDCRGVSETGILKFISQARLRWCGR
jgi:hypothetical protein